MASRYQPRQRPKSAAEILTEQAYPVPEVGDEGSISPEVFLSGMQDRIDARTMKIQDRRSLVKGVGKGAIYGHDKEWWKLPLLKGGKKIAADKASKKMGKEAIKAVAGPWDPAASDLAEKIFFDENIHNLSRGKDYKNILNYAKTGSQSVLQGAKAVGTKAVGTAGKGAAAVGKFAGDVALGAKAKTAVMAGKLTGTAAGTTAAGTAATGTAATGTAAAIGAAIPPLLLATLAAKFVGSTKRGKKWSKDSNKWLRKKTGTGQTKNLFSPWKWRL